MLNKRLLFPYIMVLLLLSWTEGVAQLTDRTGADSGLRGAVQIYHLDARTTAMGSATIADATGISSMHMNPALLSFVRRIRTVQIDAQQIWDNNLQANALTLPAVSVGQHRMAVQLGYHRPGIKHTTLLESIPNPVPDLSMAQVHAAYSYSFNNVISAGILNTISYAYNSHAQFRTYHVSAGVIYSPSESVRYGLVYRGLGRSITYELIENGRTTLGSQRIREALELGVTLTYPVDTDQTYLAVSLSNEKRFGESGIWYKGGVEVKTFSSLYLRSGILFNPEVNVYAPRFGLGFEVNRFMVDYTISHKHLPIDRFHQFGLTIQL